MEQQPYTTMSDLDLMSLCCYREARGEGMLGKRGVCHVIQNRAASPGWWGHDVQSVILKPWQFSSFNATDPNSTRWPEDTDPHFQDCILAAQDVLGGMDSDVTQGATHYHDTSIGWPSGWGAATDYVETLAVGRLKFYKKAPPVDQRDVTVT